MPQLGKEMSHIWLLCHLLQVKALALLTELYVKFAAATCGISVALHTHSVLKVIKKTSKLVATDLRPIRNIASPSSTSEMY